jgi:molybdenum cofactor biosynthesis enzyme MoaA
MLNRPHQKLRIHKQIDALYKWKNNIDFIPPFVEISPISYCNQECKFCYTTHLMQKLEKMPTEVFLKLVRNLGESGVKGLRLQGIGEPTLHPDLGKAINVAGEFNLETALTTNGVLMREKLLNECLENLFSIKINSKIINDDFVKVYN